MSIRYQPLGPLLSGEGSRAFLGLALEDGVAPHPVVLIWAPQEVAQDADLTERLRRETNRALVFEHPNILRVHGLAMLEQGLARVTEYADGETLRRIMEVTPKIPPPLAAKIVADAAMGVHYAHMAGNDDGTPLVHGDMRPETIIISYTGVCKVTGYGALGVAPRERGGRRVRNRRKYSAPEQLLGGRDAVNVQTDVFLLGLTLYELLTGKIPFKDAKDADTATLTELLPTLPPWVPRGLDAVVHKATAKRANERYPTALALREAIVATMGDLPAQDVLSTFMNRLFPPSDEARQARVKVLEFGLSEALKHSGGAKPAAPAPAPAQSPVAARPAVPAPAPSPVVARPAAPALAPAPAVSPAPQPAAVPPTPVPVAAPARRSRAPLVVGSLVLISAGGALVAMRGQLPAGFPGFNGPQQVGPALPPVTPPLVPLALADAGTPADAGLPGVDAGTADGGVDAGMSAGMSAGMDAGMDAGVDAGVDAGMESALELIVDPRVEALLQDGGTLGRTPLTVPMAPGRYPLSLSNSSLGINTSRMVTVNPTGRTTVRIYLNKGYVNVHAPAGGTVQVDGHNVGTAPVSELDLYEGQHRLTVMVNGARWQKSFTLEANQRVTFSVNFEEPEE
jgi:hypothetical protein